MSAICVSIKPDGYIVRIENNPEMVILADGTLKIQNAYNHALGWFSPGEWMGAWYVNCEDEQEIEED